jgi:hypothetical protein
MSQDCREDPVGITGIDGYVWNLLTVPQPEVAPGAPGVIRAVHPIADGQVRAVQAFTAAHVDYLGIGWSDGDCANRLVRLIVKQRLPGPAGIVGLPDTAIDRTDVENIGLGWDSRDCASPAAPIRADHPPFERGGERVGGLR